MRIGLERVAGSPDGSSFGITTWADITMSTPCSAAALNGGASTFSHCEREWRITGRPLWLSTFVSPCPGKCLAALPTPASWNPSTAAPTMAATRAGSDPYERAPITGLAGLTLTSATGAKSRLMPSARSSSPVTRAAVRASSGSRVAPMAMLPGTSVTSGLSRETRPFSWSAPMISGIPEAFCRPPVSLTSWPALSTLPAQGNRMTPPGRYLRTTAAGVAAPNLAWLSPWAPSGREPYTTGMKSCPTLSSRLIAASVAGTDGPGVTLARGEAVTEGVGLDGAFVTGGPCAASEGAPAHPAAIVTITRSAAERRGPPMVSTVSAPSRGRPAVPRPEAPGAPGRRLRVTCP